MGLTRRKRQSRPRSAAIPRLHALSLATPAAAENSAAGTLVSAVLGATAGSTLALVDNAGGRFALSGGAILTGAVALDREAAASHAITLRETLAGYANSPRDTVLTIDVLNVFEAPDLGTLSLSRTEFVTGSPAGGTILGATAGSSIAASGAPAGLTFDGAARTLAWDGTGSVASGSLSLTETHPDASNSPRVSTIGWAVVDAPSVAISDEFPVLKAAYEAGDRALIAWIGDSTVANAGGLLEENSTAYYLRQYLADAGLAGVIGGCFSNGNKSLHEAGISLADYADYYDPDASYDASFAWLTGWTLIWGGALAHSTAAGDKIRYDPGFAFDRVELFHVTFSGAGAFDLKVGATTLASINGNQATAVRKESVYSITRGTTPVDMVVASGDPWPLAVRCWDSTADSILQVENLGVSSYRCTELLSTTFSISPGNTAALIGAHLVIIQVGLNDKFSGGTSGDYQTNLTALINLYKGVGCDVLVCKPIPTTVSGTNFDSTWLAAVSAACTAAGIGPPVDLYSDVGFDTGTDLAPDGIHPIASGNFKIVNGAAGVGARILGAV